LPAGFDRADVCAAALKRLCDGGHRGLVATDNGRTVAVMTAAVRDHPAGGRYARLPAEGFAVEPDLGDPTGVLAVAFGDLASPLIADGVLRYYLLHIALPRLSEALSNLGFGRNGAYGVRLAAPRRRSSAIAVRVAEAAHLDAVARLALVEIEHRSAPPMFAPPQGRPLADLVAEHRALHDSGAVHLVATLDGHDVGLLTVELTSPVPRLCPDGQPYIGPTATLPGARGQGVGRALVDAALTWAYAHGYQWVSVDFDTANPLSRPFWLNAGFHSAGYGPGTIKAANLDGTGVTSLVQIPNPAEGVAVDASNIFWSADEIDTANLDGTNPHTLITGLNFGPAGVAVGPK
jgi:GNAT superfamily N-acetyltransferase